MQYATRKNYVRPTSKGQVTLPAQVRQQLRIDPDTLLDVVVERGRVILTPLRAEVKSDTRDYTAKEIDDFLRDDVLSKDDAAFFKKLLRK